MTTYVIGLFVVALFYGLFWNNRPAREVIRDADSGTKRDGPTRTGQLTRAESYPDGASIPISAGHQSQRPAS